MFEGAESLFTYYLFSLRLVRSTLKELRELTHLTEPTDCCVSSGGVPNGVAGH